ncbi:MAG: hypothetical protein Kow0074_06540 [Candidatus Zixiibacteriota bacterium]
MKRVVYTILTLGLLVATYAQFSPAPEAAISADYSIRLASGERQVSPSSTADFVRKLKSSRFTERGVLLQFYTIPDQADRRLMEASGITLHKYIPNSAFLATVPTTVTESDLSAAGVRWIGELRTTDKIAPALDLVGTPGWARDSNGVAQFTIKVFPHIAPQDAAEWLAQEYGAIVDGTSELINAVAVRLPAENWYDIAGDERVQWIEPYLVPREANNSNRVNTAAEVVQQAPYSLDGSGAMVGEWDGGRADWNHPDFAGRIYSGDQSGISGHATHVAGSVMGSGSQSGGTYRGMAPGAELVSYNWFFTVSNLEDEYTDAINNYDIDISTNSWIVGYGADSPEICDAYLGNYFSSCEALDEVVRGSLGKPVAIAWAAGNERSTGPSYCGSQGFTFGSIPPYGTSKNVITIGAINSNNSSMTSFSSWGPVDDGRLKPELVAPGCQTGDDWGVTSTRSGGGYTVMCGTSMATPTAAGCFALWMGRYKELYPGQEPLGSTVKAVFCEGADDIGDPGPEFDYGFGRLNVQNAIDILNAGAFVEAEITDGDTLTWLFTLTTDIDSISFTLAWDDPGAAENANPTLINDLDLRVQTGLTLPITYRPWVLNPDDPDAVATIGSDHTNNIEKLERSLGIPTTGTWRVLVIGHNIPEGPQKFSLAHSPELTLTPGEASYAANLIAGADVVETPGGVPVSFQIFNVGREPDTYDLSLTSSHGWTISPNPAAVAVPAREDTTEVFIVDVPLGTAIGTIDTVECTLVSQTDPGIVDVDSLTIEVIAGYGAEVTSLSDTVGVPGRQFTIDVVIKNTGTQADVFDWTVTDNAGWTIAPSGGTESLPLAGQATIPMTITVSPLAPPGLTNNIVIEATSQSDPTETGTHSLAISVIDFPPEPVLVSPINGISSTETSPQLVWQHDPYDPFPPGFDVFEYVLEIAGDTGLTLNMERYEGLTNTSFTFGAPLDDGVYYWRVVTYNAAGDSSGFSPSARFEVDTQAPDAPILLEPDFFGVARTPTFQWSAVTSNVLAKVSSVPMTYHFELANDTAITSLIDTVTTAALSYLLPVEHLLPRCSTVVYWRVTATDAAGNVSDPTDARRYQVYIAGDVNYDCILDARDMNALIDQVFFNIPPPDPEYRGEVDCVNGIDAVDLNYLIDYLFFNGPSPCVP